MKYAIGFTAGLFVGAIGCAMVIHLGARQLLRQDGPIPPVEWLPPPIEWEWDRPHGNAASFPVGERPKHRVSRRLP